MIDIVRSLGAPVMDPPGNAAARQSKQSWSVRKHPVTVLTSWCTVA